MNTITVRTIINAPIEKVWEFWTKPEHITGWAFASDDWEAPSAENDLRVGGTFKTRMQAKDLPAASAAAAQAGGSTGFDFSGVYTDVKEHELIEYEMDDGRKVTVRFEDVNGHTKITETFDPEHENSEETQRDGWQAILDNFKKYVEKIN